jgi:hypothetical protein
MGRFGKFVAQGVVALVVGVGGMSAFVPAAHAVDGCTAEVETLNDQGQVVSDAFVPCTGGMQNGYAYLYDTHGTYLGSVSDGGPPDPPLVPLSGHSGGGSTGGSHSSSSGSGTNHGAGTSHPKPNKPGTVRRAPSNHTV